MDQDKTEKILLKCIVLIFAAAISFIAVVFLIISRTPNESDTVIPPREPEKIGQVLISPNAGGSAPTPIPSATPSPLEGMAGPIFCKLQMAGLSNKAKEQDAAGIVTLNRYEFGKNACIFEIKNAVGIGNSAELEIAHNTDTGEYQITVQTSKGKEEPLLKWGETALLFLNSDISATAAETSIREALENGTSETTQFSVSSRDGVSFTDDSAIPVRILEIKTSTDQHEINIVLR